MRFGFATYRAPVLVFVLMALQSSCVVKPLDSSTSELGGDGDAGTTTSTSKTPQGADCGKDPTSGVTLCSGTSACPDVVVDGKELPGCGFRTVSPSFDLECVCNGTDLCPIGVAATCAEAADALAGRSLNDICNQVGSGTCRSLVDAPAKGKPGSSACDRACAIDCAGSPTCLKSCGC
jgi:hypothetical protein